jgi:hypothetical protein
MSASLFTKAMDQRFIDALMGFATSHAEEFDQALEGGFLELSKMAAARRQLNTAIWLWFKEADLASIHTLTAAAFRVLAALYFHEKKQQPTPLNEADLPNELRPYAKSIRNLLAQSETFLKHARLDPDDTHAIPVAWTENFIFNAIKAYTELKGTCDQPLMSLFIMRFSAIHPDIFGGISSVAPLLQKGVDIETLKRLSRVEFFDRFGGEHRFLPPERLSLPQGD